ncbi:MAG: nucleoside deaminase [Lewinellaceae bacterium]|nr:nucleoside deaminase [Lewinellaceae bacterium]
MNFTVFSDEHFMRLALQQAELAAEADEIPVGAIVVCQNQIIARAYNRTEALQDVTAHAEILALTTAAEFLGSKYLTDCTLYVTLEPCVMCAGALKWAQLDRLVFGASDEKEGFMRYGKELLHPQTKIEMGLMEEPCRTLLQEFFREKRALSRLK